MSPRSGGIWRATQWRHTINPAGPNAPRALFYSRVSLLRHRNSSLLHASRDFQDEFVCLRLLPPCATNRLKLWLCIKFTFFVISICSGHQLGMVYLQRVGDRDERPLRHEPFNVPPDACPTARLSMSIVCNVQSKTLQDSHFYVLRTCCRHRYAV